MSESQARRPGILVGVRLRSILFTLFLVVPIIEIALFVVVGTRIGLGPTLAIVVLTAVAGSWLVARQGAATWLEFQAQLARGELPAAQLAHGAMILVAGALLLTPGFLTDLIGFALLVPAVRETIRVRVVSRYRDRWQVIR